MVQNTSVNKTTDQGFVQNGLTGFILDLFPNWVDRLNIGAYIRHGKSLFGF
jgi:hypothetical protein